MAKHASGALESSHGAWCDSDFPPPADISMFAMDAVVPTPVEVAATAEPLDGIGQASAFPRRDSWSAAAPARSAKVEANRVIAS